MKTLHALVLTTLLISSATALQADENRDFFLRNEYRTEDATDKLPETDRAAVIPKANRDFHLRNELRTEDATDKLPKIDDHATKAAPKHDQASSQQEDAEVDYREEFFSRIELRTEDATDKLEASS